MAGKRNPKDGAGVPAPRMLPIEIPPEEYARAVRSQKLLLREMADTIEAGNPIEGRLARQVAAQCLRHHADKMPETLPGKKGPPKRFCHASAALGYAMRRTDGMSHGEAVAEIADREGVSEVSVGVVVRKHRAAAFALMGATDPDVEK